jgi:hypothetical protein
VSFPSNSSSAGERAGQREVDANSVTDGKSWRQLQKERIKEQRKVRAQLRGAVARLVNFPVSATDPALVALTSLHLGDMQWLLEHPLDLQEQLWHLWELPAECRAALQGELSSPLLSETHVQETQGSHVSAASSATAVTWQPSAVSWDPLSEHAWDHGVQCNSPSNAE